jgi:hypothetical protein
VGALVCRPREHAGDVVGTSLEHESPFATDKGLQSFPTLIRQFGQSFLVRDVMVPRDKIVYVEPSDLPAALDPSCACPPACGGTALPSAPGVRYNPHSEEASGSVHPVLPGGPASAVVGLSCAGPAG